MKCIKCKGNGNKVMNSRFCFGFNIFLNCFCGQILSQIKKIQSCNREGDLHYFLLRLLLVFFFFGVPGWDYC